MALRCVYTDLDGTMLGKGGSLLRDAEGDFSTRVIKALEACHRANVEVVIKSGRRRAQVYEDARLIGQPAYIYEMGCALVDGQESVILAGEHVPEPGRTVHEMIERSGAPRLLLERFAGRLEYHEPWHVDREFSHLFRGKVDVAEVEALLGEHGHGDLRLVDNGAIARRSPTLQVDRSHAYHLVPREAGKANAVRVHMQRRGLRPEDCIAVGDSREDLRVADVVGRFYLVANALQDDPDLERVAAARPNVLVTEEPMSHGFYEAVVRSLAEL